VSPANALVLITLIAIWTSMLALARRDSIDVSARTRRLAFTLSVGVTAAILDWSMGRRPQPVPSDLASVWVGARALFDRRDPYEAVRPAHPLSLESEPRQQGAA
jgi:hypothetical protein